jgi:hypothetical protein
MFLRRQQEYYHPQFLPVFGMSSHDGVKVQLPLDLSIPYANESSHDGVKVQLPLDLSIPYANESSHDDA